MLVRAGKGESMHSSVHSSISSESSFEPLNAETEDTWDDVEPDQERLSVVSLFDDEIFPGLESMLSQCKSKHSFDFVAAVKVLELDFYSCVKFVNYIRSEVGRGNLKPDISSAALFESDEYLQPVLRDDAVLFSLDEVLDISSRYDTIEGGQTKVLERQVIEDPLARIVMLEEELRRLQSQFSHYRQAVEKTLDARWSAESSGLEIASTTQNSPVDGHDLRDDDTHYFASYAYNDIHETMLKDTTRTSAYRDFIYENKHLFADKVILDVGCGTGILSMFCAKAGAKKVIAVDNSDIILKAREIVFENNLSDVITCVHGKIEEVTLPVDEVDVIVSEWMGYCLLYEAMLDSVLWARDRYLSPAGLMVPSHAILRLAPISDPAYVEDTISYWHEVYGFRMSAMLEKIYDDVLIRSIQPGSIAASASFPFMQLSLQTITREELDHTQASFDFTISADVDALDGFAIWFDILFQTDKNEVTEQPGDSLDQWKAANKPNVAFTTGPYGQETHWRNAVLLIDHCRGPITPLKIGQRILGSIRYDKRKTNSRELEIDITWQVEGVMKTGNQMWLMH